MYRKIEIAKKMSTASKPKGLQYEERLKHFENLARLKAKRENKCKGCKTGTCKDCYGK